MGGRTSQSSASTQTTSAPQDQQINLDMLMGGARDYFQGGGPKYFSGPTVASPDAYTTQGRDAAAGYATGGGLNFVNGYQQGEQTFLNPNNIYNPSQIPGYAAAREGVMRDANANLTRNILPAIRAGAVADGAYGGSRQGIAEGLAAGEAARGVGDTLARMDMDAYGQGLQMYNSAANRAPSSFAMGLAPSGVLRDVGAANTQDQQRVIDSNVQRWNFEQMAPLLALMNFRDLTGSVGQYGSTTTGQQQQGMSGGNSGWLQGLGSIMSLASMFGGG